MEFEPWLNTQGYSAKTIQSTLRLVKRAGEAFQEGSNLTPYTDALRRVAAWAAENPMGEPTPFLQAVINYFPPLKGRNLAGGLRGLAPSTSAALDETQWQALLVELSRDTDPKKARCLQALLAFPYPARDLQLHLTTDLAELIRQAPPSVLPILRLVRREGASTLADYLDPKGKGRGRAAYHALHKHMLMLGQRIGVSRLTFRGVELTPWRIRARTLLE